MCYSGASETPPEYALLSHLQKLSSTTEKYQTDNNSESIYRYSADHTGRNAHLPQPRNTTGVNYHKAINTMKPHRHARATALTSAHIEKLSPDHYINTLRSTTAKAALTTARPSRVLAGIRVTDLPTAIFHHKVHRLHSKQDLAPRESTAYISALYTNTEIPERDRLSRIIYIFGQPQNKQMHPQALFQSVRQQQIKS